MKQIYGPFDWMWWKDWTEKTDVSNDDNPIHAMAGDFYYDETGK